MTARAAIVGDRGRSFPGADLLERVERGAGRRVHADHLQQSAGHDAHIALVIEVDRPRVPRVHLGALRGRAGEDEQLRAERNVQLLQNTPRERAEVGVVQLHLARLHRFEQPRAIICWLQAFDELAAAVHEGPEAQLLRRGRRSGGRSRGGLAGRRAALPPA
ncbi:MAG: hypothetical protein ACK55I_25655, partial [bacterium]